MSNTNTAEEKILKTITAVERDGFDLRLLTVIFEIPDKDFNLLDGIKAAVGDYIKTSEGRRTFDYNCEQFNLADVVSSLPNKFCEAHGFKMIDSALADMDIDWDYSFVPDSYEPEEE